MARPPNRDSPGPRRDISIRQPHWASIVDEAERLGLAPGAYLERLHREHMERQEADPAGMRTVPREVLEETAEQMEEMARRLRRHG